MRLLLLLLLLLLFLFVLGSLFFAPITVLKATLSEGPYVNGTAACQRQGAQRPETGVGAEASFRGGGRVELVGGRVVASAQTTTRPSGKADPSAAPHAALVVEAPTTPMECLPLQSLEPGQQ